MNKQWLPIKNYENKYEVSNTGLVRNIKTKKYLKPTKTSQGYYRLSLFDNNTKKNYFVHRLVAEAFIPKIINKSQINHINTIKTDNRVENLEWVTPKENIIHSIKHNLQPIFFNNLCEKTYKKVKCIETNVIYKSITEASIKCNTHRVNISRCLHGKRKTAGGYHWALYNESEG
jgi:hypothetical protein